MERAARMIPCLGNHSHHSNHRRLHVPTIIRFVFLKKNLLLHWPIPALLVWALSWLLFSFLQRAGWDVWLTTVACALVGALCSVLASTPWRRLAIAAGFPLSLLLSGAVAIPGWAWLIALVLIALVYPMNAWRDAPLFPTPFDALRNLAHHAPLPDAARVLDAGCGLGHGLRALRAAYPQARLSGTEWSWPLRVLTGLLCPWASIRQGDMWKDDWSSYDMVYLFQRPESMPRAATKAMAEMKSGAWLVSLEFPALELTPYAKVEQVEGKPVWIYQAPLLAIKTVNK